MSKRLLAIFLALALSLSIIIVFVTLTSVSKNGDDNTCSEANPRACYRELIDNIHFTIYRGEEVIHVQNLWDPGIPFRYTAFKGSENSKPQDLADPYVILFFFYDDLREPDNLDLIITINPVDHPATSGVDYVVVFLAEGAHEKKVCYGDRLIHHYRDDDPTSNYGIFASWKLDKKGPCL